MGGGVGREEEGAMVLGKFSVPGRHTSWKIIGQGTIALAVGAVGGCLYIFSLVNRFSFLSPSLEDGPI